MDAVVVREMCETYEEVCEWLPGAIIRDGRPQRYYYERLGISRSTWHRRMRLGDWTMREIGVLVGLLMYK